MLCSYSLNEYYDEGTSGEQEFLTYEFTVFGFINDKTEIHFLFMRTPDMEGRINTKYVGTYIKSGIWLFYFF